MTSPLETRSEQLSPTLTQEVERVCDAFEAAWRAGPPPRVEDFLAQGPEAVRPALLRHLLGVDADYRRKRGEQPRPEDYAGRFPAFSPGWIAEALDPQDSPDAPAVPPAFAPGQVLKDRYEILAELGHGAMGIVFRAVDQELHREVAVKMLRTNQAGAGARARFLREARALAALDDEHVVPIYEFGAADGYPFFIMPLLRGETLARRFQRHGAFPAAEVARLGEQIARGLAATHARGLVHRDVKPSNIWLKAPAGEGALDCWEQAKLMDFGLTRDGARRDAAARPSTNARGPDRPPDAGGALRDAAARPGTVTLPGALLGTPAYMAPEQAADPARADARSDLFSLGCVLYEAATGRPVFGGSDLRSVLHQIASLDPPPPVAVNPVVPPALSGLIAQLLAKDPTLRPTTATVVADRFRELHAVLPAAAAPRRPRRTARWAVPLAVLLASAAVGYVLFGRTPTAPKDGPKDEMSRSGPGDVPGSEAGLDREIAQWALNNRANEVVIHSADGAEHTLKPGNPLPPGPLQVIRLDLRGASRVANDALIRLRPLSSLVYLDLDSPALTDASLEHITQPNLIHLRVRGVPLTNEATKRLGQMANLEYLDIGDTSITDAGLEHLKGLKYLKDLDLRRLRSVTDKGLRHLQHFPTLRALYLQDTGVTDAGLEYLRPLKHLEVLYLGNVSGITDEGVRTLKQFANLRELYLKDTRVTDAGVGDLRQALPRCKISY